MKKAILFEPKLLAKIKQNSPAVYEYYCNSPLSRFDFVDYGVPGKKMYIQEEVLRQLGNLKGPNAELVPLLIKALQYGYMVGVNDLAERFPRGSANSLQSTLAISAILNLAINYPYYTMNNLTDTDNFDRYKGTSYSKWTYKEAQYFVAWNTIFSNHEKFNKIFIVINEIRKRDNLDNMGIMDFNAYLN